jgi:hypothetical protein
MRRIANPFLALVVGVAAGYWLGYSDAYKGPKTLGARVGAVVGRVKPDAVSEARARNAEQIRATVHQQAGVNP